MLRRCFQTTRAGPGVRGHWGGHTIVTWTLLTATLVVSPRMAMAGPDSAPSAPLPAIRHIELGQSYLAAGETVRGVVGLDLPQTLPPGARLRVVAVRNIEIAAGRRQPGRHVEEVFSRPLAADLKEVPFELSASSMLAGSIQVQAEVLAERDTVPLASATSTPVTVGVRKRLALAGDWSVAGLKVLEGDVPMRRKDWKAPMPPATTTVPGPLPFDDGFRGWVTLRREVSWGRQGDLQPRMVCVDGASDSARIQVAGVDVGETAPVEDIAVLTHWVEFHCPFKGPENQQKRMLLIAGGAERPVSMALPKPLPAEGKAEVAVTLRATSGGMLGHPKPPYGILKDIFLEMLPAVHVKSVTFDTQKPGAQRRFTFTLTMVNETGRLFSGRIRTVYGSYQGGMPYTGPCPAASVADQAVDLPVGESRIQVVRDETPRMDTCRATFLVLDADEKVLDAAAQDYHTVTIEIRDRRDLYLNNERFFLKAQGSWGEDANSRLQLRLKGGNGFRGHRTAPSWRVPGLVSEAANIDERYRDGLLTSAGSALLASCEKCRFWNPKDTSNIDKAVRAIIRRLAQCPGIVQWEATNELHGEPEEARVAILEAFHKYDPYHRPVLATKSSGEWEAEARDGRVAGVDIVGCQYLLSKEALDSVTAAITEQPLMSTEVNWDDENLYNQNRLLELWLDKGVCGSLLFDYSGHALDQPVPMVPPADHDRNGPWHLIRESRRQLYHDVVATAAQQDDGRVLVTVGNRMPYTLRNLVLTVRGQGQLKPADLGPGDGATILLPAGQAPPPRQRLVIRGEYTSHGGLKSLLVLSPIVVATTVKDKEGVKR